MRTRVTVALLAVVATTAAVALLVTSGRPSHLPPASVRSLSPHVDHGPEPTIGGMSGRQVMATANFWAEDATTPPEGLTYAVSTGDLKNLSAPPRVSQASHVRDGKRFVSVSLDFPYGSLTEESSVDLTVKFTNAAGRSASKTMRIDKN